MGKPTVESVIEHYNKIVLVPGNNLIDPKLTGRQTTATQPYAK